MTTAILVISLNVCSEDLKLDQFDKLELQYTIDLLEKDLDRLTLQVEADKKFGTEQTDNNLKAIEELKKEVNSLDNIVRKLPGQSNFTQLEKNFEKRLDDNQKNVLERMNVTDSTFNFWGTLSGLFGVLITLGLAALASLHFTSIKESENKVKKLVLDAKKEQRQALDETVQETIRQANEAAQQWFKDNAENKIKIYLSQVEKYVDCKIEEIDNTLQSIAEKGEAVKSYEREAKKIKDTLNEMISDDYSKMVTKNKSSSASKKQEQGKEKGAVHIDEYNNLLKSAHELYQKGHLAESLDIINIYLQYQKSETNTFDVLMMKASILMQLKEDDQAQSIILEILKDINESTSLSELVTYLKAYLMLTVCIYNKEKQNCPTEIIEHYLNHIKSKSDNFEKLNEEERLSLTLILRNLGIIYSKHNKHSESETIFEDVIKILISLENNKEKVEWDIMEAFSTYLNMIKYNDMGRALSYATESLSNDKKQIALSALTFITHNLNEMTQYKNCSEVYLENINLVSKFDNILSDMCKLNGSKALYETNSDVDLIINTIRKLTDKYENSTRKGSNEWLTELDEFSEEINKYKKSA
ncbi:hypothetical protein [Photobacterium chitinilyticum]|uniref:hypothetical protein n=1 Tax=Photobacterium chitinilyticum TaxID=2485123 RepID=UPI003D0FC0D8